MGEDSDPSRERPRVKDHWQTEEVKNAEEPRGDPAGAARVPFMRRIRANRPKGGRLVLIALMSLTLALLAGRRARAGAAGTI